MRAFLAGSPVVLAATLLAAACGGQQGTQYLRIEGRVVDESGDAIVGARIAVAQSAQATTDDAGAYRLVLKAGDTAPPLAFAAEGFAPAQRALSALSRDLELPDIVLRAVDKTETVTLPAEGAAPVSVAMAKHDGQVMLSLPAGGLVDASGAPVTGEVAVSLTYWHPQDLGASAPGLLTAVDQQDNQVLRLRSFGMADVRVAQGGRDLEVAPGAAVDLAFTVSAMQRDELKDLDSAALPSLFHLDPAIGQWRELQRVDDPNGLVYDAGRGTFTARLPHFSEWNIDEGIRSNSGGCVSGQVIDGCTGAGLASQVVTFWYLSFEEVARYQTRSDASGNWCVTTGTPNRRTLDSTAYLVTGATMAETNQCNPLPARCRDCTDNSDPFFSSFLPQAQCNRCRNWDDTPAHRQQWYDTPHDDGAAHWYGFYGADNICNPPPSRVTVQPCSFCPSDPLRPKTCNNDAGLAVTTSCAKVDQLILPGPGCQCVQPGQPCQKSQTCCIGKGMAAMSCQNGACAVKPPGVAVGQPCDQQITCADGLACGDGICIPASSAL